MLFLHVFGDNVEDVLGRGSFLLFYTLCGLGAVVGQILVDPNSMVPMIGASGAISGVLAGYLTLFPHARVVTLIPIFIFIHFMEVPAGIFIVLWFVLQLVQGYLSLGIIAEGGGGVAWFAHIGGFLAGLVCIRVLYRRPKGRRRRSVSLGAGLFDGFGSTAASPRLRPHLGLRPRPAAGSPVGSAAARPLRRSSAQARLAGSPSEASR